MRIAVTGASGLIGSALVPALRDRGHEVLRLVRKPVTAPDEVRWEPVSGFVDPKTFISPAPASATTAGPIAIRPKFVLRGFWAPAR